MYLQKQLSKRIGDKEYAKYVLVIPPKVIHQLKWKGGEKLELEIKKYIPHITKTTNSTAITIKIIFCIKFLPDQINYFII